MRSLARLGTSDAPRLAASGVAVPAGGGNVIQAAAEPAAGPGVTVSAWQGPGFCRAAAAGPPSVTQAPAQQAGASACPAQAENGLGSIGGQQQGQGQGQGAGAAPAQRRGRGRPRLDRSQMTARQIKAVETTRQHLERKVRRGCWGHCRALCHFGRPHYSQRCQGIACMPLLERAGCILAVYTCASILTAPALVEV